MGVLARDFLEVSQVLGLVKRAKAPEQAGIFAGDNPADYNAGDPIRLWVIQVIVIIAMTQFLHLFLSRIRQPRVIAEVIGGVLLGPSVMGRIPNFTKTIFPMESIPMLNLTSTIGLVLFLFLVGLEVDFRVIRKNVRASMLISAIGLIIPLGLGAALGVAVYNQFTDKTQNFGYFLLFVAVAIGITAFPVLCRILTELKLLDDTVGVVVLAAGVGNDVVGWILLALTVALVNAQSGLTALWVLLTGVGYVIFLLFPVKWAYRWLARRTGSLENGTPTPLMTTVTLILVFFSAFFTDIIGIHAIFGGFLAGLVIPKDNGFAISLVEKLEDLVSLLFLPLYFAFSGLRTNLGLLDNGITWGYVVLICVVAFFSKFLGCASVAMFCGFNWRESGAIGSLMSCKGLVELIVLNVGLSAGILDTRTFSMFVLHALVLTFMTTPLTLMFYPAKYRTHAGSVRVRRGARRDKQNLEAGEAAFMQETFKTRFTVVLEKIEQLPAVMTLTQLLQIGAPATVSVAPSSSEKSSTFEDEKAPVSPPGLPSTSVTVPSSISVHAYRLIELTDRTSAVLKSQSVDSLTHSDPMLSIFRTFGHLNHLLVSASLAVIGYDEFSSHIVDHVRETVSDMLILPWNSRLPISEDSLAVEQVATSAATNPFDGIFGSTSSGAHAASVVQTQFFRKMFMESPVDVGLFIDPGVPQSVEGYESQHIFLPFFGGPDDRLALSFVVQLCLRMATSATVTRFTKVDSDELTPVNSIEDAKDLKQDERHQVSLAFTDTVYAQRDTQTQLASETADNLLWERYSSSSVPEVASALSRITFSYEMSSKPLHAVLDVAAKSFTQHVPSRPMIVVGRSRRLAVEAHAAELRQLLTERSAAMTPDLIKTLGDLGAAFVAANANTSLLVLQAAP